MLPTNSPPGPPTAGIRDPLAAISLSAASLAHGKRSRSCSVPVAIGLVHAGTLVKCRGQVQADIIPVVLQVACRLPSCSGTRPSMSSHASSGCAHQARHEGHVADLAHARGGAVDHARARQHILHLLHRRGHLGALRLLPRREVLRLVALRRQTRPMHAISRNAPVCLRPMTGVMPWHASHLSSTNEDARHACLQVGPQMAICRHAFGICL